MLSLGAPGISQSALAIVRALENDDWAAAYAALGQHTGTDQREVARQAVVLGADDTTVQTLLTQFNEGEVIEVEGKAPILSVIAPPDKIQWALLGLFGLAVAGGGVWLYRRRRR